MFSFCLRRYGGGVSGARPPLVNSVAPSGLLDGLSHKTGGKIQHVVIIIQENRSFDNLFQGFPGADAQPYGYTSTGKKVTLQPVPLKIVWDLDHSSYAYLDACDGQGSIPGTNCKMDGFDKEGVSCKFNPPCPNPNPQYSFVPKSETKPLVAMAQQYVLADKMFTSDYDGSSFVSHQYDIAAQASSSLDFPNRQWGCDGGPSDTIGTLTQQRTHGGAIAVCFENQTLGDSLDAAHLTWRYYTSALDDLRRRDVERLSGHQAHPLRRRLGQRHHAADPLF